MKKLALLLFLGIVALPVFLAAQEIVEKIEIVGNDRVTTETVLYYLSVREGDFYSADQFRRDFRVLWSTGFFSNITFEESQGARGKIVKITVEENAVVRSVTYKTGKKVKEKDIVDKLKEKDQAILPYSYYSAFKVQRIKDTIADLLTEKGLLASKIESEVVRQGKNEVDVQIRIDEGPKVRVGEVAFEGDTKIQSSKLEYSMKENRPHSLFNWVAGKDVYKSNKLEEDAEPHQEQVPGDRLHGGLGRPAADRGVRGPVGDLPEAEDDAGHLPGDRPATSTAPARSRSKAARPLTSKNL